MYIRLPRTYAEWQQAGPQLAELERVVNSLLNLQLTVRLPDGNILKGAVQMSGTNAIIYAQPFGQGGATITALEPLTTAPAPLGQQTPSLPPVQA